MKLSPNLGRPGPVLGFLAGLGMIAWILRFEAIPLWTFFLALANMGVSMIPTSIWLRRGQRTLPMFELISLSFGIHMGLGATVQSNLIIIHSQTYELKWEHINEALLLSLLGISVMSGSFWASRRWWLKAVPQAANLRVKEEHRKLAILVLLVVGLGGRILLPLVANQSLGQIGSLFNAMVFFALVLQVIFYYRFNDRKLSSKVVLVAVVGYLSVTGLNTGMLESAFVPLLLVYILRAAHLRTIPVAATIAVAACVLILNSVKEDYRERVWFGGEGGTVSSQIQIWGESIARVNVKDFFTSKQSSDGRGWRESMARFSLINRFAWVCSNTPEHIPFFHGQSYMPFIYTPIPRIVWPNKPIISETIDVLDVTYNLKMMGSTASIGIGFIAEAYANLSWWGVILVMTMQGALVALLDRLFNGHFSEGGAALYAVLLALIFNGIGTSAVVIYGNMPQYFLVGVLLLMPFCVRVFDPDIRGGRFPLLPGLHPRRRGNGPSGMGSHPKQSQA